MIGMVFSGGEGVQAKSIVEKGYWDDLFPLEGGGRVHLKFQFALSEDDRSRIRTMVFASNLIFLLINLNFFTEFHIVYSL